MDRVNTTAFISGIMIGIGNVICISVDNKYVGTMLFSLALLTIIQNKCQLYTGQIGYIREKTYSIFDWTMMLLLNCVGATYSTILGLLVQDDATMLKFITIAQNKKVFEILIFQRLPILPGAIPQQVCEKSHSYLSFYKFNLLLLI